MAATLAAWDRLYLQELQIASHINRSCRWRCAKGTRSTTLVFS